MNKFSINDTSSSGACVGPELVSAEVVFRKAQSHHQPQNVCWREGKGSGGKTPRVSCIS